MMEVLLERKHYFQPHVTLESGCFVMGLVLAKKQEMVLAMGRVIASDLYVLDPIGVRL